MIEIRDRKIRVRFGSTAVAEVEDRRPALPIAAELDFAAYSEDCRLFGRLVLRGERLSDMLNDYDELVLIDVMVESLADGRLVSAPELAIARNELLVVEVDAPRGNPARRQHLRSFPISVVLGPYSVRGEVHVTPGTDPIQAIQRRGPMVPLTGATITYTNNGVRQERRELTLLFNRELADVISPMLYEAPAQPELPVVRVGEGLAKDFTNEIHRAQ
jgi:hypothetical protein